MIIDINYSEMIGKCIFAEYEAIQNIMDMYERMDVKEMVTHIDPIRG